MDGNKEGVKLLEHAAERRRDPLGKEDGDARSDPQELDVRNLAESREEFLELVV